MTDYPKVVLQTWMCAEFVNITLQVLSDGKAVENLLLFRVSTDVQFNLMQKHFVLSTIVQTLVCYIKKKRFYVI